MKKYIILSLTIMLLVVGGCKKKNDTVSPGSIYGTITDKSTGESVPNAGVELMPKGLKTVTGYDGTFQFTQIDPGDYNLFITKTGYQDLKSNTITVKAGETAKGDVQIEKMPTSIQIIDNGGQEISSIDFGEEEGVVSKTFNIHNRGTESFSFSIIKSVDWIESITPATGTVPVNQNAPVILKIDRTKMVNGLNTTSIIVSSETVGGIEIAVKATKKKALSILDNSGTEITELDFGSDANTTQKMFKVRNNGTQSLSYTISKTANWITSVNPTSGALNSGATSSISIMINRDLLSDGENSSVLSINITNGGSEELVVKATKGSPYTGTCTVIFELFSTSSSGWYAGSNGSYAHLGVSDGTSTHQLTIENGNVANYTFDFEVGTNISVVFSHGYYSSYTSKFSYRIYYPGGDVIFEKAAGSITSGLQCTFTVDCNNPGGGGGGGGGGNAGSATIILTAGDVWEDGTGYQMLLDANHNTYGSVIPESGALSTNCSGNTSIYQNFEYKIPTNADGNCSTSNIVLNTSKSIAIPAGIYDWCITNPTPNDRIWICASNGNIPGRFDDFMFEDGYTYKFEMGKFGDHDGVDLTIINGKGEIISTKHIGIKMSVNFTEDIR
jgi:gingipain R/gingipain K